MSQKRQVNARVAVTPDTLIELRAYCQKHKLTSEEAIKRWLARDKALDIYVDNVPRLDEIDSTEETLTMPELEYTPLPPSA